MNRSVLLPTLKNQYHKNNSISAINFRTLGTMIAISLDEK
jgi:hypothetical protein